MVELAMHYGNGPVPIKSIAAGQGLSVDYLEQLFHKLRKKGLVRSVRGPGGGFVLARPPAEITAGDVVRALEGPISPVWCVDDGADSSCDRAGSCAVRGIWQQLAGRMEEVLDGTSLADLCADKVGSR